MTDIQILYDGPIVKYEDAKRLGLKRYFRGVPCKHGHVAEQSVSNRSCVECVRIRAYKRSLKPEVKAYNKRNKQTDRYKKQQREYNIRKRIEAGKAINVVRKRNLGVPADSSEYSRLYYHARKSEDPSYGLLSGDRKKKRTDYAAKWASEWRDTVEGKATTFMRKCITRCLSNKTDRTHNLLGYTKADLISHIERQFRDGMSWDNHGEWHIDHIVPVSWFINAGVNDPKVVNKLTNLRPLWADENLSKGGFRKNKNKNA